jgi:hypothetical protein
LLSLAIGVTKMCRLADAPLIVVLYHRFPGAGLTARSYNYVPRGREPVLHEQTVSEMVVEVLALQAKALANRTRQPFKDALVAILKTDACRQLEELAEGPYRHDRARDWLSNMAWENVEERYCSWLEDSMAWLEDEAARAEYQAFLHQELVLLRR